MVKKRKSTMKKNVGRIALLIFVAALAIRLIYLAEISRSPTHLVPIVDAENYDALARTLVFEGMLTQKFFWQGFFYPLFLAAVYAVSGGSIIAAKVLQLILGAVTCVIVYSLGERILDRRTGIIAAAIAALSGPLVFFDNELLATGWASFWSVVLIVFFLNADAKYSVMNYLLLGIYAGMSTITRATFFPFVIAASIWLLVRLRRRTKRWTAVVRRGAVLAAGFLVVTIPVAVLCQRHTGEFSFLPQSGAINLYIGNNPDTDSTLMIRPGSKWRDLTRLPTEHGATSIEDDQKFFMDRFRSYLGEEPGGYVAGLLRKAIWMIGPRELPRNVDVYIYRRYSRLLSMLVWKARGFGFPFGILLPCAIVGLVIHRKRIPVPVYLFLALYPLAIILVFVTSRYRTPVLPVLAVPSAMGLGALFDTLRKKRWARAAIIAGVVAGIAVLTSLPGPFAVERFDYEAEMHCMVGFELSKDNRQDEAVHHLTEALRLRPDYGDAHKFLGLIRNRQRRPGEAIDHLEKALAQDPDSYLIRYYLAAALLNLGLTGEAVEHLERALEGAEAAREEELASRIRELLRSKREMDASPD